MNYLKEKTNYMENCCEELERDILALLMKRLKKIDETESRDIESLLKLQNVSGDLQSIEQSIEKTIAKAKSEMYEIVDETAREYYEEAAEKLGEDEIEAYEENYELLCMAEKVKQKCASEIAEVLKADNLGLENAEGEVESVKQAYRDIINEAIKRALRGEDIDELTEQVIASLTERGLLRYGAV